MTNKEVEKIRLDALLGSVEKYLNFMVEFSKKPDYRGDLSGEIKRLTEEVSSIKEELNKG
jgi:hypothetical protein